MAKLSYSHFFLLVLLVISATAMVPVADAQKRCQAVLNPNTCDLATCRQDCLQQYNGNGLCRPSGFGTSYSCVCVYNC